MNNQPIILMRSPSDTYPQCVVRVSSQEPIDLPLARAQHLRFGEQLRAAGAEVKLLRPLPDLADSVFIEDAAIVINGHAWMCPFATPSRVGEEVFLANELAGLAEIDFFRPPAVIDGGDCIIAEGQIFLGLSSRTNQEALRQLKRFVPRYNVQAIDVDPDKILHLKSGATYVGRNTVVLAPHLVNSDYFRKFDIIEVPPHEAVAANCVYVNSSVFVPAGCTATSEALSRRGFQVVNVEMSEFIKGDGSLTCLCLFV